MIISLVASIIPTILLMLVLLTSFNQLKDNHRVQGMTDGVVPIVGVMMAVLTWKFLIKAKDGLGWKMGFLLLAISFLMIEILNIHPGLVIGLLLILALVLPVQKKDKGKGSSQ